MPTANGYAAMSSGAELEAFAFQRRDLRPHDLLIDVLYCGICHSDIHTVRNEWDGTIYAGGTLYPCLPGHEIVGRVHDTGSGVTSLSASDVDPFLNLLAWDGTMALVGIPAERHPSPMVPG